MIDEAYAAGLFDGEGHISISHRKADTQKKAKDKYERYHLSVSVSQNNGEVLRWLKSHFGGSLRFVEGKRSYDSVRYQRWSWSLATRSAANFLALIQPYAIVKREEIAIALKFQSSIQQTGRKRLSDETLAFRAGCFAEIRANRGTQKVA